MRYWSRDDTKDWIDQLESRVDDIDFYLNQTFEWCMDNEIEDQRVIFMCAFLTCVWVCQLRGELISFIELMEILQIKDWECAEDKFYELNQKWIDLDHIELLEGVADKCQDGGLWEDDF